MTPEEMTSILILAGMEPETDPSYLLHDKSTVLIHKMLDVEILYQANYVRIQSYNTDTFIQKPIDKTTLELLLNEIQKQDHSST